MTYPKHTNGKDALEHPQDAPFAGAHRKTVQALNGQHALAASH